MKLEPTAMENQRESAKYHVVSMRVSDKEKHILETMKRQGRTTVSRLMREAIRLYTMQQIMKTE